jgi:putative phosphoribosyl transferase
LGLVDPVVLALPRGGVPVAAEVADALHAPLDLLLVRKIGAPAQRELAVAAIAEGPQNEPVIDRETLLMTGATMEYVQGEARAERLEISRRRAAYLRDRPPLPVEGKTAVVVDDGIATGTTVRAALQALRRRKPARLVLAVPVAPPDVIAALRGDVDDVVCLSQPEYFRRRQVTTRSSLFTVCTPGADHAAPWAASRSCQECTLPRSVTTPPLTST